MSVSAIVHVCTGGVKNQFTTSEVTTAAKSAGPEPSDDGDGPDQHQVEEHLRRQVEVVLGGEQHHREDRYPDGAEQPAGQLAAGCERRGPTAAGREEPLAVAAGGLVTGDHVHVDRAGGADHPVDDGAARQHLPPPGSARGAEHELGRVLGAGEADEAVGGVGTDDLVVDATQVGEQLAVLVEALVRRVEAGVGAHVDTDQLGVGPGGDTGGPADQVLTARRTGDGDDDAFPGLPGLLDPVGLPVVPHRLVDPVSRPQQGELAESRKVPDPEVVGQCRVDLLGGIDVAVSHPAPQGLGGHVDQLDLIGRPHHLVGHGLLLLDAGDLLHHVVDALEVLDVHRRDHVDAGGQQLLDVLPALEVATAGDVGVGELVDQGDLRATSQHRVDVHLLEGGAAVLDTTSGHDLEVSDLLEGLRSPVGLDQGDHDVGASMTASPTLVEHGERLADARRRTQIDTQLPAAHA